MSTSVSGDAIAIFSLCPSFVLFKINKGKIHESQVTNNITDLPTFCSSKTVLLADVYTCFLPISRERVPAPKEAATENIDAENQAVARTALESPPKSNPDGSENEEPQNGQNKPNYSARSLMKSASISGSKCIGEQSKREPEV